MRKIYFIVPLCCIFIGMASAQDKPINKDLSLEKIQRNSLYVELGGSGGIISLNYERTLPVGNKTGLGFRVGAGTAGSTDTTTTDIAYTGLVEVNLIYGKSKNFLETGIGFTNAFVASDTEQWCSIKLGYRYQAQKGFLFKIAPMYIYNFEKLNGNHDVFGGIWLGVSFGYSF